MSEFKNGLANFFKKDCDFYEFSSEDLIKIQKLVDEKYSNYEWNIGSSPKGENTFTRKFSFGIFTLTFNTEKGKIKNPTIYGDFFSLKSIEEFACKLNGIKFERSELEKVFACVGDYIFNADAKTILDELFSE